MVAVFNVKNISNSNLSVPSHAAPPFRCHVRRAVKRLADAIGILHSEELRERMFEALQAAVLAEIRISELENRLAAIEQRDAVMQRIAADCAPPPGKEAE